MNRYYRHYGITHPGYMVIRRAGSIIRSCAEQYFKGRLLDIGCGEKLKVHLVGDLVDEYVGLDYEGTTHDRTNVDIWGTAYEIPEPDESFDCVLCTAVLEHLEEPERALQESFRILKPGGHAIYTVPFFWHLHEEPRDFFRFSKYGLTHLFGKAGYHMVDIIPLSGFWLTFGSEWNYYLNTISIRPFRYLTAIGIMASNFAFRLFDSLDIRINRRSKQWTWAYLIVGRKPGAGQDIHRT